MNHKVIISLASNFGQEENLSEARRRLAQVLSALNFTAAIWTAPINSPRPDKYLNQLLHAQTTLSSAQTVEALKAIETTMGRTAEDRRQGIVRIDLDLLQYDDTRFHLRDWERPYVKLLC